MTALEPETGPPIGVLLAQLGTPAAPTAAALRPYLREFLSDPRVVDLPRWQWLPILYLFVLTRRPARSAALYRRIWTPEGSPLLLHSQAQVKGLQERLGARYRVALGMRYGRPSIGAAMRELREAGAERLLVFPMFPQFSCSTTGSIYDAVVRAAFGRRCPLFFDRRRQMPALRFAPPYYEHPAYIAALKTCFQEDLERTALRPDHYLLTFHGIPNRYVAEGDPYRRQCEATAQLLARALQLREDQWTLGFQSRFGKEPWLEPYTEELLRQMGGRGIRTLAAACPGFTADCLETLDEIGHEGARQFREGGGQTLHLTPCLNSHPAWLEAMAAVVGQECAGWV
jgi:ferrochelatase